jgi:HPt (histidine-containing phosphotransfer) domain-containing protein
MDQLVSLEYYDRIFSRRGPEFRELVRALEEQLESYAKDLGGALASRDWGTVSRLRHSHRPAILNLRLNRVQALETEIAEAIANEAPIAELEALAQRFATEVRNVTRSLAESRQ